MPNNRIIYVLFFCLGITWTPIAAQNIFFVHESSLWRIPVDGYIPEKVCRIHGAYHQVSPDGQFVAMSTWDEHSGWIDVLHLESKTLRTLPIPSKHCFRPRWSPNGQKIAFNVHKDGSWKVGGIDLADTSMEIVSDVSPQQSLASIGGWGPSGDRLFFYTASTIYEVDLHHTILRTIEWRDLAGDSPGFSGSTTCSISHDNRYLLYNTLVEDEFIEGMIGAIDAVFVYDMISGTSLRVSPPGMFASEPHWIPGSTAFIYTGITQHDVRKNEDITRIYRSSLEHPEDVSILVDEGKYISVSLPQKND